jgi:pilus assembly protein CpaF
MTKISLAKEMSHASRIRDDGGSDGMQKEVQFENDTGDVERAVQKVQEVLLKKHASLFQRSLLDPSHMDELKRVIGNILEQHELGQNSFTRDLLRESVVARIAGFGALDSLLQDPEVSEIMVNSMDKIYVERGGNIQLVPHVHFSSEEDVFRLAQRIVSRVGRTLNAEEPSVTAKLVDGSRVSCEIPPVVQTTTLSIRRAQQKALTAKKLIETESVTQEILDFLKMVVRGKLNIVVAGATSTGKTSLLRLLASYIPEKERLITIEEIGELQLAHSHLIAKEATKRQTIHKLLIHALHQRPDRILVGEVRGAESVELLDAMGTGHEGSMTTLHSRSPYDDTVKRLARAMLRANLDIPFDRLVDQILDTVDLVVFLKRFADGSRKITHIVEVKPDGFKDIYRFEYQGISDGNVQGKFQYVSHLSEERRSQIFEHGVDVPDAFGEIPL